MNLPDFGKVDFDFSKDFGHNTPGGEPDNNPGKQKGSTDFSAKQQRKVRRVMHEYKEGTLHSGRSKRLVKNRSQAVAIALSSARKLD